MTSIQEISRLHRTYNMGTGSNTFSLLLGPPFASSSAKPEKVINRKGIEVIKKPNPVHYGHITAGMIKDTISRFKAYQGYYIPRQGGFDCHGLPAEQVVEKDHSLKTREDVLRFGIGNFNMACRSSVLNCADTWRSTMYDLKIMDDYDDPYKTMDLSYMNSVWWVFKKLYEKGRIYEGCRVMPYSTSCATPLSNFETQQNYKEVQDDSLFLTFNLINPFKSYNVKIMVWTTTPWTLPSNYALCVNENIIYVLIEFKGVHFILAKSLIENVFKKQAVNIISEFLGSELVSLEYEPVFTYNTQMIGKNYIIISDDYVKDTDGTGVVHIAPAYGQDDHRVCLKNGIITKDSVLFQPLDANGYVNNIEEFNGMYYKNYQDKSKLDFNTAVIIRLKQNNNYFDKRQYTHNYPFCWRTDTPLIYRAVSSWFVRVEDMRDKLVSLNKQINWIPSNIGENRFGNWLAGANDWGISRNRYWGTPIPIWKSDDGDIICVGSSYELEILTDREPGSITDIHKEFIDGLLIHKNGKNYYPCGDVLDCWFESGSAPYATVGRVGIVELLRNSTTGIQQDLFDNSYFIKTNDGISHKFLPADLIAEGLDQTRGWFYTLLVLSASLFDTIPFKNVVVNGLVLAEDGKKMSKRLKNYPDPLELVEEYGSDSLRLYLMSSPVVRAEPIKFSENGVREMKKNVIIPLTNTISFFKDYYELYNKMHERILDLNFDDDYNIINPINCWIINEYNNKIQMFKRCMSEYNLMESCKVIFEFVEVMNNGYIKMGRSYLKGNETVEEWEESLKTMYFIIRRMINDFKCLMPEFCDNVYNYIKSFDYEYKLMEIPSIHLIENTAFISLDPVQYQKAETFNIIYNIIKNIYTVRSMHNITFKKPIKKVILYGGENTDYHSYLNFIADECNIIDVEVITDASRFSIRQNIIPVRASFFKMYKGGISSTFDEISKMTNSEKQQIINTEFNGYYMHKELFNFITELIMDDAVMDSNFVFKNIEEFNINIIVDKRYDDELDKIYYYRSVASRMQRCRKYAGVKPKDNIIAYYEGSLKYDLNEEKAKEYIMSIVRMNYYLYNQEEMYYKHYFEDIDLTIYLKKI